jgi:hypothetical protein
MQIQKSWIEYDVASSLITCAHCRTWEQDNSSTSDGFVRHLSDFLDNHRHEGEGWK